MNTKKRFSIACLSVCLLMLLIVLSSCAGAWGWLWDRETTKNPNDHLPDNSADETNIVFEGAVEFGENDRHSGTGIYFRGDPKSPNRNRIVVIDAYHQKNANSEEEAVGPGSSLRKPKVDPDCADALIDNKREYEYLTDMAIALRNTLYKRGYSVVMIRETNNVDVSNKARAQIANAYNEFGTAILIRLDIMDDEDATKSGATAVCPSAQSPYPDAAAYYERSSRLSEFVLNEYEEALVYKIPKLEREESDNETVLNWSKLPATILQMGFISNRKDRECLNYRSFCDSAVDGIANGIDAYYAYLEGILPETSEFDASSDESAIEPETLPITDPVAETEAAPDTDSTTNTEPTTDTSVETTILFEGGVDFDAAVTHGGVDIYYPGKADSPNRNYIVVIDAGHQGKANLDKELNGPDPEAVLKYKTSGGSVGCVTGQTEPELNLDVSLRLRDLLMEQGYSVVMIRETADVDISNKERAEIANKYGTYGTAVFLRIHANGDSDTSMRGGMVITQTSGNPYPDCVAHYEESARLAGLMLDEYCAATGFAKFRRWETDSMTGHNWSRIPTVTMEMAFLSNPEDDQMLLDPAIRQKAAIGMANAIAAYYATS